MMDRQAYSTDLTDTQWALVELHFPPVNRPDGRNGRPREHSYREILNADEELLRTLIDRGADVNIRNKKGQSALSLVFKDDKTRRKMLKQAGAKE